MTFLSAGTPMFLFGEEVGVEKPFLYDHVLENRVDIAGESSREGKRLFAYYRALIKFRLEHPALQTRNIDVLYTHNVNRVIAFHRWADGGDDLLIAGSLNNQAFMSGYIFNNLRIPDGWWKEIFNSDANSDFAPFGGGNIGNLGASVQAIGGRFEIALPANGFVVFARQ
jgi:1,4-alpha-glucan branching enzyme